MQVLAEDHAVMENDDDLKSRPEAGSLLCLPREAKAFSFLCESHLLTHSHFSKEHPSLAAHTSDH